MAITTQGHEQTCKESTIKKYKTCTKCGQTKSFSDFYNRTKAKDGLMSECITCNRTTSQNYRLKNLSKIAETKKAWGQGNRDWNAPKEKLYRAANKEKITAYQKKWARENADSVSLTRQIRRARKLRNGVFLVTRKELKRLYANPCAYCGAPSKHIDHVIPISRGGTHSIGNLVGACAPCNLVKGKKFIMEWRL